MKLVHTRDELWDTNNIVCPHCGALDPDSGELVPRIRPTLRYVAPDLSTANYYCRHCVTGFVVEVNYSVSYRSTPVGDWPDDEPST